MVSVDQSFWFQMTGDGGTYQIVTTNCPGAAFYSNDTQMALYRGSCDSLELVLANDDLMPFWDANYGWYYSWIVARLEDGEQYYLMVDGYNWNEGDTFQGVAQGTFCILMTETTYMEDTTHVLMPWALMRFSNPMDLTCQWWGLLTALQEAVASSPTTIQKRWNRVLGRWAQRRRVGLVQIPGRRRILHDQPHVL